jgi:hypothetical protein
MVSDDRAGGRCQRDKCVLIAKHRGPLDGPFLRIVADIEPQLVAFDPIHAKPVHHAVVQFAGTSPDRQS